MKRICLISELLLPPFDEGMKIFTWHLARYLDDHFEFLALTNGADPVPGITAKNIQFGKGLVSRSLRQNVRGFEPDSLIYVPEAALTNYSMIRTAILGRAFPNVRRAVIGLQPRTLAWWGRTAAQLAQPLDVFVQSNKSVRYLAEVGVKARAIPSGVDPSRFCPLSRDERAALRKRYGFAHDAYVVSHVGHLVPSRNLDILGRILDSADVQVLIVGSTSTERDQQLADRLRRRGATIWTHVVEHIEEVYQMSDAYIFPVKDCYGAMEMPLSVLEALACATPVLATPFGALREHMADTGAVRFFETEEELERELAILRSDPPDTASICSQAAPFYWGSIFDILIKTLKDSTS